MSIAGKTRIMDKTDKKTENYELGCGMRQAAQAQDSTLDMYVACISN